MRCADSMPQMMALAEPQSEQRLQLQHRLPRGGWRGRGQLVPVLQ